MDSTWNIARRLGAALAALAAVSLSSAQEIGPPYSFQNQNASGQVYVKREVAMTATDGGGYPSWIRINNGQWIQINVVAGPTNVWTGNNQLVDGWTGLAPGGEDVQFDTGEGAQRKLEVSLQNDGTADYTVDVPYPSVAATVSYQVGVGSTPTLVIDPVELSIAADGSGGTNDPLENPPLETEAGILLLDNRTGETLDQEFGDELLELAPGYNSFPFNGAVDGGFPSAMPDDMQLDRITGPDGTVYWVGRIVPGSEYGPPEWTTPPSPIEIYAPDGSNQGPGLKIPGGTEGVSDYLQLPPGVTPGNNLPLPGGMTPGSPGLPEGVTPGTGGALPDGVISGGSNYLPDGVTPGTITGYVPIGGLGPVGPTPKPAPGGGTRPDGGGGSGGGGGGTTGGQGGGGVVIIEGDGDGYVAGPDMSKFYDQGQKLGEDTATALADGLAGGLGEMGEGAAGIFGEGGFQFWQADEGILSGSDSSWLQFTLPLAEYQATIEIPANWVSLIRAILLWGVKLWFVWSVIKLFLR
ncbi:MAG: hypothetical protein AAGB14_12620 [Verrucomicrobiota bacterium]